MGLIENKIIELEEKQEVVEQKLRLALVPKDPNDDKNVIIEIRAGTRKNAPLVSSTHILVGGWDKGKYRS